MKMIPLASRVPGLPAEDIPVHLSIVRIAKEPPRPPGETNRPRACRTCNGDGGKWVKRKEVIKGKVQSADYFEVCRACGGSGNK